MALFGSGDTSLKIIISAVDEASAVFDKIESRVKKAGDRLTSVGKTLSGALTAPLVGAGAFALKTAIDYESAFAGVRKTVNATEEEFQALSDTIRGMAKEMPTSANELAAIGEIAGQLGVGADNLGDFIKTIAMIGDTTNLAGEQAATAFARIANVMQEPLENVDRMGSVVVDLGNSFATTEAEIAEFAQRIAGAGAIAGLTTRDVFGIGAAMSSVGVQAEAGGTAVQKVLLSMNEAVLTSNKDLQSFATTAGMSAEEFGEAWQDSAGEAFTAFVLGLGKQGDNAIKTLQDLGLEDQRLVRAFLSLANSGDLVNQALNKAGDAWRDNTALTEEARKRYETTASQLKVLWNRVKEVGMTLGESLLPILRKLIEAVTPFLEKVAVWASKFGELSEPMQKVILVIVGLVAALGPLVFILGQIVLAAPAFAAVFTVLTGPIGIVIAALVGLVFAVKFVMKHWDELKAAASAVWEQISQTVKEKVEGIKNFFTNTWNAISDFFKKVWDTIVNILKTYIALVIGLVAMLLDWLFPNWQENLEKMLAAWQEAWNGFKEKVSEIITNIKEAIAGFFGMLAGHVSKAMEGVKSVWTSVWASIVSYFTGLWEPVKEAFQKVIDWILEKIDKAIQKYNELKALLKKPLESVQGAGQAVGNFFNDAVNRGKDILGFQHGGIVPGPEGKAVPIMAHGQERIIPARQASGMGGSPIVININNPVVRSDDDLRRMEQMLERQFRGLLVNYKISA